MNNNFANNRFVHLLKKNSQVIIYAAIIVLLNVVGVKLFKHIRLDLTRNKSYTISQASENIVANLTDPLRIKIFFTKNLPPQYASIERYLRDLMPEYAASANRYFNYTFYDCTAGKDTSSEKNKENIKIASDFGIYEVQVQTIEKDEVKVVKAYMGMAIQHGDMIEKISPIESTEGLEYKITSVIQNMINKISVLQGLTNEIKAKLFLSSDFMRVAPLSGIQGLDSLPEKIKEGIDDSNDRNFGKVKFIHYSDPNDENINQQAKALNLNGLSWNDFRSPNGEIIKAGTGYSAVVIEHEGKTEVFELLETKMMFTGRGLRQVFAIKNLDNLEDAINGLVDNLLNINEEVGYLTGKGNIELEDASNPILRQLGQQQNKRVEGANFYKLLSAVYTVRQMEIREIDPNVKTLIIAGAKEDFSDYELFQIDQYLMKGRSLVVFHDGVIESAPPFQMRSYQAPTYKGNESGLEKMLSHYGVTIKNTYAHDEKCYVQPPQRNAFGGGMTPERKIKFAPIIYKDQINKDLDILANLNQLIMFKVSPLEVDIDELASNNVIARSLLTSSTEAWEVASLNPFISDVSPSGEQAELDLGYILEGAFTSYFVDKGIPQETNEESSSSDSLKKSGSRFTGDNNFVKQGKPGKIIVIGSSEMIKDQLIDANGRGPNAMFIMNLIDYSSDKSDWALMRTKLQQYNPLEPFDENASPIKKLFTHRQNLKYFNVFGLPLIVGSFGLMVFYRRKNQKKMIENKFN